MVERGGPVQYQYQYRVFRAGIHPYDGTSTCTTPPLVLRMSDFRSRKGLRSLSSFISDINISIQLAVWGVGKTDRSHKPTTYRRLTNESYVHYPDVALIGDDVSIVLYVLPT